MRELLKDIAQMMQESDRGSVSLIGADYHRLMTRIITTLDPHIEVGRAEKLADASYGLPHNKNHTPSARKYASAKKRFERAVNLALRGDVRNVRMFTGRTLAGEKESLDHMTNPFLEELKELLR